MRLLTQRLFQWWCNPQDSLRPQFAADFEYIGPSELVGGADWLYLTEQAVAWEGVVLLEIIAEPTKGAIVFQGRDPVTLLKHRVAWFIEGKGGALTRLIETIQVVQ